MKSRIILDLCGGTGSWSLPYKQAHYDVHVITEPAHDVRTYVPPENVYGILAAPPCTEFSLAKNSYPGERNTRLGMETVEACLRIIWECNYRNRLKFWALENPATGFLPDFLGQPAYVFQPFDFGHPYSKKTALWGKFNTGLVTHPVQPTMTHSERQATLPFDLIPDDYVMPPSAREKKGWTTVARSITPPGFARAFFNANR